MPEIAGQWVECVKQQRKLTVVVKQQKAAPGEGAAAHQYLRDETVATRVWGLQTGLTGEGFSRHLAHDVSTLSRITLQEQQTNVSFV